MILSKEEHKEIFNTDIYDGSQIHSKFAYTILRDKISPTGDIFIFRAPMDVTTELIDEEDVLNKDFIWSDDALNFIWQVPNLCPVGAVAFQRLFCVAVANMIAKLTDTRIEVDGDDMMVNKEFVQRGLIQQRGKASVSITYSKENVALGHLAVNITAGDKAPHFAYSTKLTDNEILVLCQEVDDTFYHMTRDMWVASSKINL